MPNLPLYQSVITSVNGMLITSFSGMLRDFSESHLTIRSNKHVRLSLQAARLPASVPHIKLKHHPPYLCSRQFFFHGMSIISARAKCEHGHIAP